MANSWSVPVRCLPKVCFLALLAVLPCNFAVCHFMIPFGSFCATLADVYAAENEKCEGSKRKERIPMSLKCCMCLGKEKK